jgi:nitrate reductase NapE component
MAEETLFQDGDVAVTTQRVRVGNTTYSLRNITSVRVAATPGTDQRIGPTVVLGVIMFPCLGVLIGGLGGIVSGTLRGFFLGVLTSALGAALCGAVGFAIWYVRRRIGPPKPNYHCALATSGEEVQAISSKNRPFIEGVVEAINVAIVRAGI